MMSMADPSYRRLDVDERRRQLLERGAELFTSHRYDELSMSRIAAEVGISKSLLYHYFPSKQAFFEATLGAWAEELRARTEPDPDLSPPEQLTASLDGFLSLVEENSVAYGHLMGSATGAPRDPRPDRTGPPRRPPPASSRASIPTAPRRRRGPRSAAGSGSWTAPASTGSSTVTSSARSSATCCSAC